MPESFGARLRQQREKNGIALGALAKQTRIKESLLDGLERDDLSQWPTGLYRRAFFRAYASAIGLDAEAACAEFQQVHPEPPEGDVVKAMAATLGLEQQRRRLGLRDKLESALSSFARFRAGTPIERQIQTNNSGTSGFPLPAAAPAASAALSAPGAPSASASARELSKGELRRDLAEGLPSAPTAPVDFVALARVCTDLGSVGAEDQLQSSLHEAADLINATGMIVWALDPHALQLQAVCSHGYSRRLMSQLPMVRPDDHNATAEAFRTAQARIFTDAAAAKSAVAIPLRTSVGCVGVLAVELAPGVEPCTARVAALTLLAVPMAPIAECVSRAASFDVPQAVNGEMQFV